MIHLIVTLSSFHILYVALSSSDVSSPIISEASESSIQETFSCVRTILKFLNQSTQFDPINLLASNMPRSDSEDAIYASNLQ